jgi:hypothetical protein
LTEAVVNSGSHVSQVEYARLRGVSKQRVNALVRQGRIALREDGSVDVEASDAMLEATLDRSKAHRDRQIAGAAGQSSLISDAATGGQPGRSALGNGEQSSCHHPATGDVQSTNSAADYWEHKARRERIEADRAELALAKQRGELADIAEVRRLQREVYSKAATSLMQIPARIAPVCVALDAAAIEKAMHDEIERVLLSIAQNLEAAQ